MNIIGWVERDGHVLRSDEIIALIKEDSSFISQCGGEFCIQWDDCIARDMMGIIPGPGPAGSLTCHGETICEINPQVSELPLYQAIQTAIELRGDEGITALSGGVDSALVAAIARRPCLVVGMPGSHDVKRASEVASILNLSLHVRTITPEEILDALAEVNEIIPEKGPVDIAIATTLFFVSQTAHDLGYERILTGQGADEIFGGYARYADKSPMELEEIFSKDFASLKRQGARDQAVAAHHGTYLSMPYLDPRVVCAARKIPPSERVAENVRKKALRDVACRFIPSDIALYEKKAMQYGTGIWKEIKRLARQNGYQNSVSDFIDTIGRT